jgi:membrane protein DedA with SNARE-associated domain
MHSVFDSAIQMLITFAGQIGYLGIFIGMFLESTLLPLPSELIMIPAGIAASQGGMNIYVLILVGTLGNVSGAIFSYYLAASIGRTILLRLGKYFFVKPTTIIRIENFFKNHGPISVFIGRLLPGFRHFISLPAGIAKMNIKSFCLYTMAGSVIWTTILTIFGFFIGENQESIKENLHEIIIGCAAFCLVTMLAYVWRKKSSEKLS